MGLSGLKSLKVVWNGLKVGLISLKVARSGLKVGLSGLKSLKVA